MASNPATKRVPHKRTAVPGRPARIRGKPNAVPGNPSRVRSGAVRDGQGGNLQVRDTKGRYMRGGSGIVWNGLEDIAANFEEVGNEMEQTRHKAVEALAQKMLAYATFNAPWTDQTLQARIGLSVVTVHDDNAHVSFVTLSHTVDYGIYLETMQGGRFAIIIPTVQKFAAEMGTTVVEVI